MYIEISCRFFCLILHIMINLSSCSVTDNNGLISTDFVRNYEFSRINISDILIAFNQYRIKESAADMQYMSWSNDLAVLATAWTKKCTFSHRPKKDRSFKNDFAGETLYVTIDTKSENTVWSNIVDKWYQQKNCFDFSTGFCVPDKCPSKRCGHYLQVVRFDSNLVGCGMSECSRVGSAYGGALVFVCNFYKLSNWFDNENMTFPLPYTPSDAKHPVCSQCPKSMPNCFYGLCRDCANQRCPIETTTTVITTTVSSTKKKKLTKDTASLHNPTKSYQIRKLRTTTVHNLSTKISILSIECFIFQFAIIIFFV